MFKISKILSILIVNKIFEKRNNPYNLRKPSKFLRPKVHSVLDGQESIPNLGPKISDMIPVEMKS